MNKVTVYFSIFIAIVTGMASGILVWLLMPQKFLTSYNVKTLNTMTNIVPVAIIGSGPAGLSAAIYTSRANLHTVVFEGKQPGGQLTTTSDIENWPGIRKQKGSVVMADLKQQALSFNAIVVPSTIERVDFGHWPFTLWTDEGTEIHALTVMVATGATPKQLHIPGEQTYWGKGVSVCATCDAPFYKDKDVVVIGGGDSAAEEALQLASNAKHITILIRGSHMRASYAMQEHVRTYPHISCQFNTQITEIVGNENHVTSVKLTTNGTPTTLACDGVFLAIGHEPNTKLFTNTLTLDATGYIILKSNSQETSIPGIFAAGDVADHRYRQAGVAAGDGIKAALEAQRFLTDHGFTDQVATSLEQKLYDPQALQAEKLTEITSEAQFSHEVLESKQPVFVDFYTPYCPSCLQMMPLVATVAAKFKGSVKFVKVDGAKLPQLLKRFVVTSVPCFLVFYGGVLAGRATSVMTKRELQDFVQKFLQ
jgi:thioredoxin reductase (NADPH)